MDYPDSFKLAIKFTLEAEGGFANVPGDHGGATNLGVTQATYDDWRERHGLATNPVKQITPEEACEIYYHDYWLTAGCSDVNSSKLATCLFDWAVNSGPATAVKYLQRLVGTKADGTWGQFTKTKTNGLIAGQGEDAVVKSYLRMRVGYDREVAKKPEQAKFAEGWKNRTNNLAAFLALA